MVERCQTTKDSKANNYRVNLVVKRVAVNYPTMLPLRVGVSNRHVGLLCCKTRERQASEFIQRQLTAIIVENFKKTKDF